MRALTVDARERSVFQHDVVFVTPFDFHSGQARERLYGRSEMRHGPAHWRTACRSTIAGSPPRSCTGTSRTSSSRSCGTRLLHASELARSSRHRLLRRLERLVGKDRSSSRCASRVLARAMPSPSTASRRAIVTATRCGSKSSALKSAWASPPSSSWSACRRNPTIGGRKRRAFELCAQHVEHRALLRRRRRKRYVETARIGVFQLDRQTQRAGALAAAIQIGADPRQQHAQGEEYLRFVGGAAFAEDRGLDRDAVSARHEGRRSMPRASSCQLRPCGAETAHERSVRQARQISEPLDTQQPQAVRSSPASMSSSASGSGASSSLSVPGSQTVPSATCAAASAAILFDPRTEPQRASKVGQHRCAFAPSTLARRRRCRAYRERRDPDERRRSAAKPHRERRASLPRARNALRVILASQCAATLTQSSIAHLLRTLRARTRARRTATICLCLRTSMRELEAARSVPQSPCVPCIDDPLERAVQAQARPQRSARRRRAPPSRSRARRCDARALPIASKPNRASAIAGMSTSRQMRERSKMSTARTICERLAGGNDQDSFETGSRLGQRRRIERAVVEDCDQAPARHAGHQPSPPGSSVRSPPRASPRCRGASRRRGAGPAPGWRSERALRPVKRGAGLGAQAGFEGLEGLSRLLRLSSGA